MCNLPNMTPSNLEELSRDRKKEAAAKTIKMIVPERQLLESST
jgi:hypothetical protein